MAGTKTIRGLPTWKYNIILLTCLFQLRVHPTVPYPILAILFNQLWPKRVIKIFTQQQQLELKKNREFHQIRGENNDDIEDTKIGIVLKWFAEYLEETCFKRSEEKASDIWRFATGWSQRSVLETLVAAGFCVCRGCFGVVSDAEMWLQVKWRREGDWRAGSLPLPDDDGDGDGDGDYGCRKMITPTIGHDTQALEISDAEQQRKEREPGIVTLVGEEDVRHELRVKCFVDRFRELRVAEQELLEKAELESFGKDNENQNDCNSTSTMVGLSSVWNGY